MFPAMCAVNWQERVFAMLVSVGFGLFLDLQPGLAQELAIDGARFQSPDRIVINYTAEANVPYVLLQGDSLNNISVPVSTNSASGGTAQFVQIVTPSKRESYYRIRRNALPTPVVLEPVSGTSEVGVTVRPKATFPKAVDTSSLNPSNFFASFAGKKLDATIVPANDGTFAWLFLDPPMPSASQISITVNGSSIRTKDGALLDADGDGAAGGLALFNFSTVSVMPLPGTALAGRVVDPGPDLSPRTLDDIRPGGGTVSFLLPIAGVKVYLHGREDQVVYTDSKGWFQLDSVPSGDVKVVLDGRTATTAHDGFYWPEMVMDTHNEPGITNYITMIGRATNALPEFLQTMYLPRVASNILQTVAAGATNTIRLQSKEAAYDLPPSQVPFLTVEVQPNSLIGMSGLPMASGQIGISVVPPELVADMLPPGLLQHTFDITVQAPGIATFSTPAPMTFPNVFNAPAGTKLNFLSFDHTTGRLVIEGTATVSADGLSVRTDPGTGITHPGWHGLTPPGANGGGGGGGPNGPGPDPGCPDCPPPTVPKNCNKERELALNSEIECGIAVATIPVGFVTSPELGCAISFGIGLGTTAADCYFTGFNLECGTTFVNNMFGSALGCIPSVGGYLGAEWTCGIQAGQAHAAYKDCQGGAPVARVSNLPQSIPQNIWYEQQALWRAAAEIYAIILGDPKWTVPPMADFAKHYALLQAVQQSVQASSSGGTAIIQTERDAILQLPTPANIAASDVNRLLDRVDQMVHGRVPDGGLDLTALGTVSSNLVQVATTL
ncbi:MAG: Phosphoesterase, PA-phosphatase related protein, partial [Verrucomicrobiales bacterium]|nr:Phosphoesterase, PA-phosphatase related protein [Verrucomicrobiales bacterium]